MRQLPMTRKTNRKSVFHPDADESDASNFSYNSQSSRQSLFSQSTNFSLPSIEKYRAKVVTQCTRSEIKFVKQGAFVCPDTEELIDSIDKQIEDLARAVNKLPHEPIIVENSSVEDMIESQAILF